MSAAGSNPAPSARWDRSGRPGWSGRLGPRRWIGWLDRSVPSDYRFAPPLVMRFLGVVLVGLGLLTVVLVTLAALLDLPGVVTAVVVAVVIAVITTGLVL